MALGKRRQMGAADGHHFLSWNYPSLRAELHVAPGCELCEHAGEILSRNGVYDKVARRA
jgi:hypothetical protein